MRGSWSPATGTINIDPSKDYQTTTIVHELLHALSTSTDRKFSKVGLSFLTKSDETDNEFEGNNVALIFFHILQDLLKILLKKK